MRYMSLYRKHLRYFVLLFGLMISIIAYNYFNADQAVEYSGALKGYACREPFESSIVNSHNERKSRNARRLVDQKTAEPKRIYAVGETGRITTGCAESLGLSIDERIEAQLVLEKATKSIKQELAKRAKFNPEKSNQDESIFCYEIKALDDRGASIISEFKEQLEQKIGQEKSSAFFEIWKPGRVLAGFGRYDVSMTFRPSPSKLNGYSIRYTYTDPDSGKFISSIGSNQERFTRDWGDVFDFTAH
jgi:hypothetical protein